MTSTVVLTVLLFGTFGPASGQQQREQPSSTYIPAAALRAVLESAQKKPVADLNVRTVSAGSNDVLVNVARRTEAGMPAGTGLAHRNLTEVYYVIEGAGVLVTGGTLRDAEEMTGSLNIRGKGIEDGETQRIQAGDVVVIPAGTPHLFRSIEGTIVYLNIRIDPGER